MDQFVGRFLLYVPIMGLCIGLAWYVNHNLFRAFDALAEWWRLRKQAKADLHHTYRKGER